MTGANREAHTEGSFAIGDWCGDKEGTGVLDDREMLLAYGCDLPGGWKSYVGEASFLII